MATLSTTLKILIGLTFLTPTLVVPALYSPYTLPKVLAFRGLVELMLGVYVVLALGCWGRFGVRFSWVSGAVLAWSMSLVVSSLTGLDWRESVFHSYSRMLGLDTLAHYVAFYFMATSVLKGWAQWKPILRWFLGAVVLVLAVGLAQKVSRVLTGGPPQRAFGTLGNAIYFGGLGASTVWLALLLALREQAKGWRLDYVVAGVIGVIGVMISGSRGALVALLVGAGVMMVGYGLASGPNRKRRWMLVGTGAGGSAIFMLVIIGVAYQGWVAQGLRDTIAKDRASLIMQWADATDHPALGGRHDEQTYLALLDAWRGPGVSDTTQSLASLNAYLRQQGSALDPMTVKHLDELRPEHMTIEIRDRPVRTDRGVEQRLARVTWHESVPGLSRFGQWQDLSKNARFMAWAAAMDAFMDRPVLGWGPNNFEIAYNQFYQPEPFGYAWRDAWYDNAHNVLLNTLAEQGMFGLVTYLMVITMPIMLLWRTYRRRDRGGDVDVHLTVVGTAMITTHLVHNLFAFENPTSYLYLMLMLAMFNSQTHHTPSEPTTQTFRLRPVVALGCAAVVLAMIWSVNLRVAVASQSAYQSIRHIEIGDPKQAQQVLAITQSQQGLSPSGLGEEQGHSVLKRLKTHAILGEPPGPPSSEGPQLIGLAVQIAQNKDDLAWSQAMQQFAVNNPQQRVASGPAIKQSLHQLAILAYDGLGEDLQRHPLDIHITLVRARIALQMAYQFNDTSRIPTMEQELSQALKHSPRCQEVQYVLSAVKLCQAKPQQAIDLLEQAAQGLPRSDEGWWRLVQVYVTLGQPDKAKQVIRRARRHGVVVALPTTGG